MRVDGNFTLFSEPRPAVMIVSHERSGTHFLMNALAACYGYVSMPWIDFDRQTFNINFFYPPEVCDLLLALADRPLANVVKSHHPPEFFAGELRRITERYQVFVICRDPTAVMVSFWRYMHQWPWNAGPKTLDALSFARAAPSGRMICHQPRQYASMMHRWAAHVEGWLEVAANCPRVVIVRYEDLDSDYETTVRGFTAHLGRPPRSIVRPARDYNVIPGGPRDPTGKGLSPDLDALRRLCLASVGPTMSRLGYA
ncbi:MAG TPA: sulfotransferase domain-containing protein [Pirellulales bacterium]|nr:sulfotransferase domain-containing protein [Pirellulales bacterium]